VSAIRYSLDELVDPQLRAQMIRQALDLVVLTLWLSTLPAVGSGWRPWRTRSNTVNSSLNPRYTSSRLQRLKYL
jgi:hypothetical protein